MALLSSTEKSVSLRVTYSHALEPKTQLTHPTRSLNLFLR